MVLPRVVEDRRADGDVGQMRAAVIGRVQRENVAGADAPFVEADDRLDRAIHRAQMHRHMRRVGDEAAVAVEHRAGEVEPLLDVDGIGGVLQRHAHLLGDRHEEIVENLQHHRIGLRADRLAPRQGGDALQDDMVLLRDLRAPAFFDDDRLVRLDDQRRAVDLRAEREIFAQEDARVAPFAVRKETRRRAPASARAPSLSAWRARQSAPRRRPPRH